MKKIITLLTIALMFACTQTIDAQVTKTLVKSITLDASEAVVSLPGQVVVKEWDNTFARLTSDIQVVNFDEAIARQLIIVGRYDLKTELKGDVLYITMPKVATVVTVKGTVLKEDFKFELSVPAGYKVVVNNEANNDGHSL